MGELVERTHYYFQLNMGGKNFPMSQKTPRNKLQINKIMEAILSACSLVCRNEPFCITILFTVFSKATSQNHL